MAFQPLKLAARSVPLQKAVMHPAFRVRTVLTNDPWTYVTLLLKRQERVEALFYWEQAQHFYRASVGLPMQSSPLLLYYSFMNAAKALLSAREVQFSPRHGVSGPKEGGKPATLSDEMVRFQSKGIVPALATYFQESETSQEHSLRDLLFNLSFIHRTFSHTYELATEMFVPLSDCTYVFDTTAGRVMLEAKLSRSLVGDDFTQRLPPSLLLDTASEAPLVRSRQSVEWLDPQRASDIELGLLTTMHRSLRRDVQYIAGAHTLWYIKQMQDEPTRISRFPITITLAAMHRLSEMCRYRPDELTFYLNGPETWLLSEFISMSPIQFIDEIAAEITGHPFLVPNVRHP